MLRYNKRPPAYDYSLNKTTIKILPIAAVLHLLIGIYMYGQPLLFPSNSDEVNNLINLKFNESGYISDFNSLTNNN